MEDGLSPQQRRAPAAEWIQPPVEEAGLRRYIETLRERAWIVVAAVVIAVAIMMFAARPVSEFVEAHPTVKVLALSFLLLIGCSLVAEGAGFHIPKGYIYFAMAFSVFVEMINLRMSKKGKPVDLHDGYRGPTKA
jgi:predicted tellurium resistance membrane protein TerC